VLVSTPASGAASSARDDLVAQQEMGLQLLKWVMGLNLVLGVVAYRGLLTFQPRMYSAGTTLARDAEQVLFTPTETAPLIIVLLSVWMLYHRRAALFALPSRPGPVWLAVPSLALGCGIYAWAVYTSAPDIQALSLIANLVGCAILWRGLSAVRVAVVPLLLLLFAVPLPSPVLAKLIWEFQLSTAQLSGWFLYVIGIPAVVSAEVIQLPFDTYQVIESCSGLRSVQTLALFSILMANLFDRSRSQAFCLFVISMPVAFLLNGVRVTTLILNPHSEIHSIHVGQGLAILMSGLMVLYVIDGLMFRLFGGRRREPDLKAARAAAEARTPRGLDVSFTPFGRAVFVLLLVGLLIGVQYLTPIWRFHGTGGAGVDQAIAEVTRDWDAADLPKSTKDLSKVSFRQAHQKKYSQSPGVRHSPMASVTPPDPPIEVFWGVGEHLDRFKTPFSPKTAFPGRGWMVEDSGQVRLEGTESEITWRLLRSGTHRVISYHWYEEYRGLLEESLRSFFALDRSPFSRELPVMAIRMATEVDKVTAVDLKRAHDRLGEFHRLVSTAVDTLKERQRAGSARETSRLLNFHLWERFFPFGTNRRDGILSNSRVLSYGNPVA